MEAFANKQFVYSIFFIHFTYRVLTEGMNTIYNYNRDKNICHIKSNGVLDFKQVHQLSIDMMNFALKNKSTRVIMDYLDLDIDGESVDANQIANIYESIGLPVNIRIVLAVNFKNPQNSLYPKVVNTLSKSGYRIGFASSLKLAESMLDGK